MAELGIHLVQLAEAVTLALCVAIDDLPKQGRGPLEPLLASLLQGLPVGRVAGIVQVGADAGRAASIGVGQLEGGLVRPGVLGVPFQGLLQASDGLLVLAGGHVELGQPEQPVAVLVGFRRDRCQGLIRPAGHHPQQGLLGQVGATALHETVGQRNQAGQRRTRSREVDQVSLVSLDGRGQVCISVVGPAKLQQGLGDPRMVGPLANESLQHVDHPPAVPAQVESLGGQPVGLGGGVDVIHRLAGDAQVTVTRLGKVGPGILGLVRRLGGGLRGAGQTRFAGRRAQLEAQVAQPAGVSQLQGLVRRGSQVSRGPQVPEGFTIATGRAQGLVPAGHRLAHHLQVHPRAVRLLAGQPDDLLIVRDGLLKTVEIRECLRPTEQAARSPG